MGAYRTTHQAIIAGRQAMISEFYVVPDGDGYTFRVVGERRPVNALSHYRWTARDGWQRVWKCRWPR